MDGSELSTSLGNQFLHLSISRLTEHRLIAVYWTHLSVTFQLIELHIYLV